MAPLLRRPQGQALPGCKGRGRGLEAMGELNDKYLAQGTVGKPSCARLLMSVGSPATASAIARQCRGPLRRAASIHRAACSESRMRTPPERKGYCRRG